MQNVTEQKMFKGIRRWQQSGLSQKAWCKKNKFPYSTFHYWYKRFRTKKEPAAVKGTADSFVQLMVQDTLADSYWGELVMPDGRRLILRQPVGADFLRTLIA
jgi:hypothetical protein